MKTFEYIIKDEWGIHTKSARLLVKAAKALDSKVTIEKDGNSADAAKLFAVMGLGVQYADMVLITVEGGDEEAAAKTMEEFFSANL